MDKKIVIYEETYRGCYEVDASLSDEDAKRQVLEDIRDGRICGPDICCDSNIYVLLRKDVK